MKSFEITIIIVIFLDEENGGLEGGFTGYKQYKAIMPIYLIGMLKIYHNLLKYCDCDQAHLIK